MAGFQVVEAHDLSSQLKRSYQCLSSIAKAKSQQDDEKFQALGAAYDRMVQAVDNGERAWGMYLCRK